MVDKKFTPKEAAIAVLNKAKELYETSNLAKAEKPMKKDFNSSFQAGSGFGPSTPPPPPPPVVNKGEDPLAKKYEGFKAVESSAAKSGASDPAAVAAAVGMKKYGKKSFEEHAHEGKKFGKSDEAGNNPDAKADAALGEKVEQDVHQHEASNQDPAHEAPMKGHIKLAKFMGRMDHKKEQKAKGM